MTRKPRRVRTPDWQAQAGLLLTRLSLALGRLDPWLSDLLDTWSQAKRNKDYDRADAIRMQVRDSGYDPDSWWPTPQQSAPQQSDPTLPLGMLAVPQDPYPNPHPDH